MSAKDDLAFVEFHREEACTNGMSSCSYSAFVRLLALADRGARFTPEHEARIAELDAQVRERDGLLRQVLDPDDCRLDHHGFCQTHGWMDRSGCPHARIRSLIGGPK